MSSQSLTEPNAYNLSQPETCPSERFAQSAVNLIATRIVSLVSMFAIAVITARGLGPSGRGSLAVLSSLNLAFIQLGNFGFFGANTYHVARDRSLISKALSNSVVHAAAIGSCCSLISLGLLYFLPKVFGEISPSLIFASSLMVGPLLFIQFVQFILLGMQKVNWMNLVEIVTKSALLLYTFLVLAVFSNGLFLFVSGQTILMAILALGVAVTIFRATKSGFKPCSQTLKSMSGYGAKSYMANLLAFLVIRADPFMINYFWGASQTGIFAVAAQVVDALLILPSAVGAILCSRVSARIIGSAETDRLIIKNALFLLPLFGLSALLAKPLFPIVFSANFESSVPVFLWLLPGAYLIGVEMLFAQKFSGEGLPVYMVIIWIPALALKIILNLAWIPKYGAVGAAYSSSITFALVFLLCFGFYLRWKSTENDVPETPYGFAKRLNFIRHTLEGHFGNRPLKILDIGCGTGAMLTTPLGKYGNEIIGIDTDEKSLEMARSINPYPNVSFESRTTESYPNDSFDAIICSEVMEHLDHPKTLVDEIYRLLRPGGLCLVTIPNGKGPFERQMAVWRRVAQNRLFRHYYISFRHFAKKMRNLASRRSLAELPATLNIECTHVNFFQKEDFERLFTENGFAKLDYRGRTFLCGPFTDFLIAPIAGMDILNSAIADILPPKLVSGWMFVFRKGIGTT